MKFHLLDENNYYKIDSDFLSNIIDLANATQQKDNKRILIHAGIIAEKIRNYDLDENKL